jgi:hypothetical protein
LEILQLCGFEALLPMKKNPGGFVDRCRRSFFHLSPYMRGEQGGRILEDPQEERRGWWKGVQQTRIWEGNEQAR